MPVRTEPTARSRDLHSVPVGSTHPTAVCAGRTRCSDARPRLEHGNTARNDGSPGTRGPWRRRRCSGTNLTAPTVVGTHDAFFDLAESCVHAGAPKMEARIFDAGHMLLGTRAAAAVLMLDFIGRAGATARGPAGA